MGKFNWKEITREDVVGAIDIFEKENPEFPVPRSTFLLYNDKKYPAKHIRGMAYKVHYGNEISKSDFGGGAETANFFSRLGFEIQYTHKNVNTHPDKIGSNKTAKHNALNFTHNIAETGGKEAENGFSYENKLDKTILVETTSNKITVPSKGVIEQKNALQLLLNKLFDGDIVCEKTFPWMKTPSEFTHEYSNLYNALCEYRGNKDFAKKNYTLRCDFVCESKKLIFEYDERQHFSEARGISLMSYSDIPVGFDRDLWIQACADIKARDNHPQNRDEGRAFYDSTRDIEAERHGYTLIRIMHGQIDFENNSALDELKRVIEKTTVFINKKEDKVTSGGVIHI